MRFVLITCFIFLSLSARAQTSSKVYDSIFPYHVDLCGLTRYRPMHDQEGNPFGHAVMFIKGACFDSRAGYPQLRLCDGQDRPDAGVGISLDEFYKNVAWTAVQGRDFLFYGDLPANQPLTPAARERILQKAITAGYFSGVRFIDSEERNRRPGESEAHFIARDLFGTDFAAGLARTGFCAQIPIEAGLGKPKSTILISLIQYLNKLNAEVHASREGLHYDAGSFNCTTLLYNALAAIGFWPALPTDWNSQDPMQAVLHANDIAAPFNATFEALRRGSPYALPFDNGPGIAVDDSTRMPLLRFGWLPSEAGVIVHTMPIHAYQNQLFYTDSQPEMFDLFDQFLQLLKLKPPEISTHLFEMYMRRPEAHDLRQNLFVWRENYGEALRVESEQQWDRETTGFYEQYLREQLSKVDRDLSKLARLSKVARQ